MEKQTGWAEFTRLQLESRREVVAELDLGVKDRKDMKSACINV